MEHQTCFDLSVAIQKWRDELTAQTNLTNEQRRELETHITDTVNELQHRGLSDEESFWLARRRLGQPGELSQEFAKADLTNIFRQSVLWIAAAFFAMYLWQTMAGIVWLVIIPAKLRSETIYTIAYSFDYLLVALFAIYVARNKSATKFLNWRSVVRSRGRLLIVGSFLAAKCIEVGVLVRVDGHMPLREWWSVLTNPSGTVWPIALVAIILWLLPAAKAPASKSA